MVIPYALIFVYTFILAVIPGTNWNYALHVEVLLGSALSGICYEYVSFLLDYLYNLK